MIEGRSYRILYIEDDAGLARLLQKNLGRQGHLVDLAENGEAGLAKLAGGSYDVVLTDNSMPVRDGLEVIRSLAGQENSPPVIMVTGKGSETTAVEALKLGATDYIVKDMEMGYLELLPIVIEQVMQNRKMIREREQMFATIRENEERYRRLVDLSPDGIAIHTGEGLVFVNPAGMALLGGERPEQLLNREMIDFVHPEFKDEFNRQLNEIGGGNAISTPWTEVLLSRLDRSQVAVEVSGVTFVHQGKPAIQIIFRDITERKQAQERLEYLANFDSLTELPNRSLFFDRLGRILAHCRRYEGQFALLFLDLDHFKDINDSMGHDAGDELLREVARRLSQCLRQSDTVARMGGDEFTILLSKINGPADTSVVSDKIIASLNRPFLLQGRECYIGVSIGIAIFPLDGDETELLLKNADNAMYSAKERGRNRYSYFSSPAYA